MTEPRPLDVATQAAHVVVQPDGRHALAGFAKRTYSFAGDKLVLADEQAPLVTDPVLRFDPLETVTELVDDVDLIAPKRCTDVVVAGTVVFPERRRRHRLGVAAGKSARILEAVGPRRARVSRDGHVRFDEPELFHHVTLTMRHAYGGYDGVAQRLLDPDPEPTSVDVFAYPRNAGGSGYFIDVERSRADGAALPQLEDPGDKLSPERFFVPKPEAWMDAPVPGTLGWIPHTCYPRYFRLVGPFLRHDEPTRPLREAHFDDGADLTNLPMMPMGKAHATALQGAAPGLACERLRGDEQIILDHLVRGRPRCELTLPKEVPRITLTPPDVGALQPTPILQTVRIDIDRLELALTWCAATPLATNVPPDFLEQTALEVSWRRR